MLTALHTVNSLHPDTGGPARSVTNLCSALNLIPGLRTRVFANGSSLDEVYYGRLKSTDIELTESKARGVIRQGKSFQQKMKALIVDSKPDLVHDHGLWLPSNYISSKLAGLHSIPYLVHSRGMLDPRALSYQPFKKEIAWRMYQQEILESAAVIFATSESEAQAIRSRGLQQPIALIPNGVDMPDIDIGQLDAAQFKSKRKVLFLGRIHPIKGIMELLAAWGKLNLAGWELLLAGPDQNNYLELVQRKISESPNSGSVRYIGPIEEKSKPELFRTISLVVVPSQSENFGLVVAESLAHGVPVIASTGTPWSELIEHKCGWWVDCEPDSLADALSEATALSDDQRRVMGLNGRAYINGFEWGEIATETAKVYHWVLDQNIEPPSSLLFYE